MQYKTLKKSFKYGSFFYEEVKREGNIVIYKQTCGKEVPVGERKVFKSSVRRNVRGRPPAIPGKSPSKP